MDQLFTTTALTAVVPTLIRTPRFLLDTFFNQERTFDTESVFIDIQHARRRVAAFCSPSVEGKVVKEMGWESNSFTPAYIKEKTALKPWRSFTRALGETFGGAELTPMQRMELRIGWTLQDHTSAVTRRLEIMAAQALIQGRITVKGEGYAERDVDFKRKPTLTFALLGNDKWDGNAADPLSDIQNWLRTTKRVEGAVVNILVMDSDAWEACWKAESFRQAMDNRHLVVSPGMSPTTGAIMIGPTVTADGIEYKGQLGTVSVYVYDEVYEDPDTGVITPILPSGTVIGGSTQIEGEQLYGAIQDEEAGLQPRMFFVKSKLEFDPGGRTILTQSAPIVVPKRPNASFSASVL